ncbi:DciA family protein [Streptomyces sp. Ac-502]|uniref:DciA family protein n=1 Tax=Streptomyces sp. Ac-502 TaxID=3342801 RepID=UPI0038626DE2
MSLEQPAWFADVDAWWVPAVGEEVAARVRPLGFDAELRLHVECDSRAWTIQVRLLAHHLAKRLDRCLPQHQVTGVIVRPYAVPVPLVLEEHWPELVGEDLGTQILPLQLFRQGQELSTLALSAEARDRFRPLIPEVLEAIRRLLGPDCALTSIPVPSLYPVTVAVTASEDWDDPHIIDSVLFDTWHDVTQVYGPEHSLCFEHTAHSQADRIVAEWTAHHAGPCHDVGLTAMPPGAGAETLRAREEQLIARKPDLCLAFLADPAHPTHVVDSARAASIPVRVITPAEKPRG